MRLLLFVLFISFTNVNGQSFPNPATLSTGQGVPGNTDPIWLVSQLFINNPPNPMGLVYSPALINNNCAPGAWVSPSALPAPINNGNWITQNGIPCGNGTNGFIYFRLQLNLPSTCNGSNIATNGNYTLYLTGYVDDIISDVFVNGISQGVSGGSYGPAGQLNMTLNNSWSSGLNYVDVLVRNTGSGPYGLLLVANYSASLNSDLDGDGIADLNDNCPCQFGGLPDGCCTTTMPTGSATQTFCNTASISNLSANGTNIQWYTSLTGGTPLSNTAPLINGTTYYASQTVGGCESSVRFPVNVSINIPPSPTGSLTQTFCNSATVGNLTATGTNIQWYSTATGGIALSIATPLVNGSIYYASQTVGGCESLVRFPVTVNLNSTASPTASSTQSFCNSATVANLVATGINIQWYSTALGGNPLVSTIALSNGTTYYVSQTINGCQSLTRFPVLVTINTPSTPSGAASQTFCNSGTIVNLVALGTNIQWFSTATGGIALLNSTPLVNGSTYYASQTVGGCESSVRFPVNVSINIPPSATGSATQTFCNSATVANLTATGSNLLWYLTATGGTPLANTTVLANGLTYYASQTVNGCESPIRFPVTVTIITSLAPTGSSVQSFCNSATVSNLLATGTNIQWYLTVTGGSPLPSTTSLINGLSYYASQTVSGCVSTSRFPVLVALNIPITPTGASIQSFCNAGTIGNLIATGSNIRWYITSSGGTPLSNTAPLINGTTYYASQTINGCESITRFPVNVIINTPNSPTGNSNQLFCNSATVANLTMSGQNIQWYTTASGGTPLTNTTTLINGTAYFASQTINGCESIIRTQVLVTILVVPTPTGNAIQGFCKIDNPIISDLIPNLPNVKWYNTLTGGTPLNSNLTLIDNTTYYAEATDITTGCKSPVRLEVLVKINDSNPPTGDLKQIFCEEDMPLVSNVIMNTSNALVWYSSATGSTIVDSITPLNDGDILYASNFDATTGCYSSERTKVDITLLPCELEINNLLTLNGNNLNDFIVIKNIETFPKNDFQIFNRYGKLVWRGYNYDNTQNTFVGKANVQGVYNSNEYLPTGTYFYVLTYFDMYRNTNKEVKGFLQINNNQ